MSSPFMQIALEEARLAEMRDEVPIGAVIVWEGEVIARSGNRTRERPDPTAHAEIEAIRMASLHLSQERLNSADLYVTLEPCAMCAAAISFARIRRLYFAASDPKGGGVLHGTRFFNQKTCFHAPEIYDGICESEASSLLKAFFAKKRR